MDDLCDLEKQIQVIDAVHEISTAMAEDINVLH